MKRIIFLAAIVFCLVARSQASGIRFETQAEDQRLNVQGDKLIVEQAIIGEPKPDINYEMPAVVLKLNKPLGDDGILHVHVDDQRRSIKARGGETLGDLKRGLPRGKVSFAGIELKDHSNTTDFYQIGLADHVAKATQVLIISRLSGSSKQVNISFEGETIAAMKEAIKKETGAEIVDQRLVNAELPIIEQKLVSQLKVNAQAKVPVVILNKPLGTDGIVYIWKELEHTLAQATGSETLGEFRKTIRPGKLLFGAFELKDDSKTLDYYQIGYNDKLTLEIK